MGVYCWRAAGPDHDSCGESNASPSRATWRRVGVNARLTVSNREYDYGDTSIGNKSVSPRTVPALVAVMARVVLLARPGTSFHHDREQLIKYTAKSPYDRFPDGRPKFPTRFSRSSRICRRRNRPGAERVPNQFVGSLQFCTGEKTDWPGVTLQLMPLRPDIAEVDAASGKPRHQRPRDHRRPGLLQPATSSWSTYRKRCSAA